MTAPEEGCPLPGLEVMRLLAMHPLVDVTVDIGGMLIDVCGAIHDVDRDKMALKIFPDDLADAIRRMTTSI